MKSIIINIIFLLSWTFIGHFFPFINLGFTFIAYPLVFIVTTNLGNSYSLNFMIPFFYSIILINDYLFRIFGGGVHDDAGRGWCELIFYITITTTILCLFYLSINDTIQLNTGNNLYIVNWWKFFQHILFVLFFGLLAYFIFSNVNINI